MQELENPYPKPQAPLGALHRLRDSDQQVYWYLAHVMGSQLYRGRSGKSDKLEVSGVWSLEGVRLEGRDVDVGLGDSKQGSDQITPDQTDSGATHLVLLFCTTPSSSFISKITPICKATNIKICIKESVAVSYSHRAHSNRSQYRWERIIDHRAARPSLMRRPQPCSHQNGVRLRFLRSSRFCWLL